MASPSVRALLVALVSVSAAAVTGCHSRWFPLASPPAYHFRAVSKDAVLGKPTDGTLSDEDAGYADGFKYEIPAPGTLLITAKPANASVQLDIEVFADGSIPIATTKDNSDKKLTVQEVQPGTLFVVVKEAWMTAQKTRFKINALFKPQDPDGANGPYKSQAGARELPADKGLLGDTVDYSAMRRTNYWRISLQGSGDLTVKFGKDKQAGKLSAEFIPPAGAPEKIDPVVGLNKKDL